MSEGSIVASGEERLDKVLISIPGVGSRNRAQRLIESGKVTVDGRRVRAPGERVREGSKVQIEWSRPGTGSDRRKGREGLERSGLQILFEDEHLIAVDKPPGLLTDTASKEQHRTRDSAYKRLRAWLRPRGDRPRTVHRIDRDTSGVVLFARTDTAEGHLRRQFKNHEPERVYRAIVRGRLPLSTELIPWRDTTRWHKGRRILEAVHPEAPGARETLCHMRALRHLEADTEIEVQLHTGRRNQIRLQAALRGHPLLGDRLYGDRTVGQAAPRQLLHAFALTVIHPTTGKPLRFECPLPSDWPTG